MKTRDEFIYQLNSAYRHPVGLPKLKKLRYNHIEDRTKSVEWNRQFVKDNNRRYKEELDYLEKPRLEKIVTAIHDIFEDYIMKNLNFPATLDMLWVIWERSSMDARIEDAYLIFAAIDRNVEFLNNLFNTIPDSTGGDDDD